MMAYVEVKYNAVQLHQRKIKEKRENMVSADIAVVEGEFISGMHVNQLTEL